MTFLAISVVALLLAVAFILGRASARWEWSHTDPVDPDHPVFQPPEMHYTDAAETGYPGTGTDIEAWATPTNEGTD